ncbi:MAG: cytochrome b/b6 domain-containing protein [bacterium]|nr:cytochrome b/b6 domain-containing protein [bacterium]
MDRSSMFLRFPLRYRIEHWILAVNFTILAITGLVQYFSNSEIAQGIVEFIGGIERTRSIHHFCAIVLIIETLVHVGVVQHRGFLLMQPSSITPGIGDIKNALQAFAYNLGFSKDRPKEGRYTFAEKAEYWAVIWGTIIMAITGFMMWNPVATTRIFPGEIIPAAKVAHSLEAILAVLAIIVWHFYFVLIKQFNKSMFTGYVSIEQMQHEHPLELADEMRGFERVPDLDPVNNSRFWKFIFPQYLVICFFVLSWAFYFVFFEQTSIEMVIPPENVTAFLPERESLAIERGRFGIENSSFKKAWTSGISDIFSRNCVSCHGENGSGGLNLLNYQAVMTSGVIIPGEPYESPLMVRMESEDHYQLLSHEELAYVHIWISNGAPLNPEEIPQIAATEEPVVEGETVTEEPVITEEPATSEAPSGESVITWNNSISSILNSKCNACHGAAAMGGFSVLDYASFMASGVVTADNPGLSKIVRKMEAGGHSGSLTPDELEKVKSWIEAGAIEGD